MAKTANEELFDALLRHQIYLMRYSGYVRNRIIEILDISEQDLAAKILTSKPGKPGLQTPAELNRMNRLLKSLAAIRQSAWKDANTFLTKEMTDLAIAEPINLQKVMNTTSPVQLNTVLPPVTTLRSIALSRPFEGRTLKQTASHMEAEDIRRVTNAVRVGMIEGETLPNITRRVIGTKALKGADGVTQLTRHQVQAVTRTAVNFVANQSRREFLLENQDVVLKERYTATLDGRTTDICASLDGKVYKLGEGPYPPLHFNCRSIRIAEYDNTTMVERPAVPVTQKQLLREYTKENKLSPVTSRANLPYGTKTKFDQFKRKRIRQLVGRVPAKETYNTWLKKQSVEFQEDVLGVTKSKLYRDGGLTLDKFVNRVGDELNLSQLAQKHASAFKAAGLDPADFIN